MYRVQYIFDNSLDKSAFYEKDQMKDRWKIYQCFSEFLFKYHSGKKLYLLLSDVAKVIPNAVDFINKECDYVICTLVDLVDTPYSEKEYSLVEIDSKFTVEPARLLSLYLLAVYFREFSEDFGRYKLDTDNLSWEDLATLDYEMSNSNHAFFDSQYTWRNPKGTKLREVVSSTVYKKFFLKEFFSRFLDIKLKVINAERLKVYEIKVNPKLYYNGASYCTQIRVEGNEYGGCISNSGLFLAFIEFLHPTLSEELEEKITLEKILNKLNELEK